MKKLLKLFIFSVLFGCQSTTKELPVLSFKIDDSGNKKNYSIKYEKFTNQLGKPFSTENIKSRTFIANFFFTRCPSICPPMRAGLIDIAKTFENDDEFLIVSHTIDPQNDLVEVLKNYSEATGVSPEKWQFVRSSLENTRQQANVFMTSFKPKEDETDFYHSSYVALVDNRQQIRGFYNILVVEEIKRLKDDIRLLLN